MSNETNEKVSWKRILQNNIYSFKFMWENSRSYLLLQLVNTFVCGFYSPMTVILTSRLFTMLDAGCTFNEAANIIFMMAGLYTFRFAWDRVYDDCLTPVFNQSLHLKIQSQLFEKARKLEIRRYDDPEFYNDFVIAMQFADSYAVTAIGNLSTVISYTFTFAATVSVIMYVDVTAMLVVLASAVLSMFIDAKLKKIEYKLQLDFTENIRKGQYIDRVHKLADYSKELRLTDLGKKLADEYDENTKEYIDKAIVWGKRKVFYKVLEAVNSNGIYMAVIALTLYKMAVTGSVLLGGFTVVVNSNWRLRNSLVQMATHIASLPQQSLYIDKVRAFMEYEPEGRSGTLPAPELEKIEFRNLCFGYDKDKQVLQDVNMTIVRGEKIAIVGYNGAGKTTLVKLLMHLYQPDSGAILYNGTDIREIETDAYRDRIGAVFQDYRIFAATVAENVLGDECREEDREKVLRALRFATFDDKLEELPCGIDTMLTREFDENGTNLSGGEAQKIAIARVFATPYDLIIMDEPSSALDPIAEYELNRHISKYAEGKTVIFISHRLSTTRHADRIYMFEDGRVIEEGSHDELMNLGGKYAEMFNVQAEKYAS